jgi:hypothetical protein
MSALKEFFGRQKSLETIRQQKRLERLKLQEQMKMKQQEEDLLKKIDFDKRVGIVNRTLNQSYFIDEDSLVDYIWDMDEDVYYYVVEHKNEYSAYINYILNKYFIEQQVTRLSNQVVKDISDYDMFKKEMKREEDFNQQFEKAWSDYKQKGLVRPESSLDLKLKDLMLKLDTAEKQYEEYKKTIPKKYIPPGARGSIKTTDSVANEMENNIQKIKNEIKVCNHSIEQLNNEYEQNEKQRFKYEFVSAL